jgi:cell division cycle 20-like protein 1 (cofactor of APC complex)
MASSAHDGSGEAAAKQSDIRSTTPQLISPADTKTPPTDTLKRTQEIREPQRARDPASEPIDPQALSRALHKFERSREHTPSGSPSRKRQRIMGDRFMPNRSGIDFQSSFNLLPDPTERTPSTPSKSHRASYGALDFQRGKLSTTSGQTLC